jgi:hypothetical protein
VAHFVSSLAEILIDNGNCNLALTQLARSESIFATRSSPKSTGVVRAYGNILRAECLLQSDRASAIRAFESGWPALATLKPQDPMLQRSLRVRSLLEQP